MLTPPESSTAVIVAISITSVSICNRFHAKLLNSIAEIVHFEGVPKN